MNITCPIWVLAALSNPTTWPESQVTEAKKVAHDLLSGEIGVQKRKFGPKHVSHPSIGEPCLACKIPFEEGDYTTLVTLGPGSDEEARRKAREGLPHNAVSIEVHWSCFSGAI